MREWGRIGCVGFGGPPAHVALLRELCVRRRGWLAEDDFEHAIAVTNLLPGPASTQLAIYCAWRLRGLAGALAGGASFIAPGLALIVALAALFLGSPRAWACGVGAGAGAIVAAVAVQAALRLMPASWACARGGAAHGGARGGARVRWLLYVAAGAAATALLGAWLVLVLVGCGLAELAWRRGLPRALAGGLAWLLSPRPWRSPPLPLPLASASLASGGLGALSWTALKVGALSYGGGFVIVPLMQADAVARHHWMTAGAFLNAVALGQATPGPVVQTVAVLLLALRRGVVPTLLLAAAAGALAALAGAPLLR